MSQAGFTPISLYFSTTAAATPSAGNLANGELAVNITDGKLFYKDNGGVVRVLATAAGAAGDVVGPGSSTDNALVRFDGTTGKLVQNSVGVLSDAGVLTGLTGLTSSGNVTLSALTSGRVTYATTAGLLTDSANLTFNGTTLTSAFAGPHNGTVGASTPNTGAFTTLNASSTVSGTGFSAYLASPPAIGGTAANTGAFTTLAASGAVTLSGGTANGVAYLNGSKVLTTGSALTFDGNSLGLGVTPSAWGSQYRAVQNGQSAFMSRTAGSDCYILSNNYYDGTNWIYLNSAAAGKYEQDASSHKWYTAPSGTAGAAIVFTQAMTLDASGNLLVGTTSQLSTERVSIVTNGTQALYTKNNAADFNFNCWNAATTGNNQFIQFITETSPVSRGSITYNRAGGLVAYNVTSDYRAKDIYGPVVDSGALIDAVPVYMGKMKDAAQERPMFIAHEVPAYAHTGVKDAVDADGNPVYQQMDASALVPVMWAEIQSLRKRLTALEAK